MLRLIKQARAAISLLNPDEVRSRAEQPVNVGLVAADSASYDELEDFLLPAGMLHQPRIQMRERVYRANDANVPERVDLVLYQQGLATPDGAYTFYPKYPETTISQIMADHEDFGLPLARQFPAFRKPFIDGLIQSVAKENALFALATALPNVVPNVIELPWAFGEFASDTAFLTANQIRMAFMIAAAYGKQPGFVPQKGEILSIMGGAFGWRALARELVSHIPLGGGLIPKGAIAYAGTYAVGKGLEYYYHLNRFHTAEEREEVYRSALDRGKEVSESLRAKLK